MYELVGPRSGNAVLQLLLLIICGTCIICCCGGPLGGLYVHRVDAVCEAVVLAVPQDLGEKDLRHFVGSGELEEELRPRQDPGGVLPFPYSQFAKQGPLR